MQQKKTRQKKTLASLPLKPGDRLARPVELSGSPRPEGDGERCGRGGRAKLVAGAAVRVGPQLVLGGALASQVRGLQCSLKASCLGAGTPICSSF